MFDLQIKKYRQLRHMSQEQLGLLCDLSPSYISRLEAGNSRDRSPTLASILAISYSLNVCPLDMLSFDCDKCKIKDTCRKHKIKHSTNYTANDIEYYL